MNRKVLVLAGGFDQIALIKELKSHSMNVILADYYEKPPAKKYADKHYQVSTLDEELIYNLALEESVSIVTTACTDQALLTAARVSERLGLPTYISAKAAMNVTNKAFMKRCFIENNIPTAKAILLENKDVWKCELDKLPPFPLVVKPCDCNSSKGVLRVDNYEQLYRAIDNAFILSRSSKVIVEQFLEGREISVDVWIDQQGAKILCISETEKIPALDNTFTICLSKYPVYGIEVYKAQIISIANDIAKAFQLSDCPMLIQALIKDGNIYVIEFSARMGGGTKYKLIEYVSGINIMKVYVNRILGITNQIVIPEWSLKNVELDYLYTENGTVTMLKGFDECKSAGLIDEYFQYKPLGSKIIAHSTSSDRVAGVLFTAATTEELLEVKKQVMNNIDILDGTKSILYKNCFQ